VIDVQTPNKRCLPSGPYRELLWKIKEHVMLREPQDFHRVVELKNKSDKMSLVTAIARPSRLDRFLPEVVSKNYFEDHYYFTQKELEAILEKDKSDSLLVTYKDFVKIEDFGLNLSLLDMEVVVDSKYFEIIDRYKEAYRAKKD
jgi:tetraacyldisaccharide 4'-kinase